MNQTCRHIEKRRLAWAVVVCTFETGMGHDALATAEASIGYYCTDVEAADAATSNGRSSAVTSTCCMLSCI